MQKGKPEECSAETAAQIIDVENRVKTLMETSAASHPEHRPHPARLPGTINLPNAKATRGTHCMSDQAHQVHGNVQAGGLPTATAAPSPVDAADTGTG
jgi:hypothetical protein